MHFFGFFFHFIGNDRGTQYRSGFYYFNEEQEKLIKASKAAYEKRLEEKTGMKRPITTEIAAASDYDKYGGLWYFAEPVSSSSSHLIAFLPRSYPVTNNSIFIPLLQFSIINNTLPSRVPVRIAQLNLKVFRYRIMTNGEDVG